MPPRAARFPLFDSLRAIAALSVVFFHIGTQAPPFPPTTYANPFRAYFGQLMIGVWIFFLVSGFLLYRPYVKARIDGGKKVRLGTFLKRRFLRIFPTYWVALAVTMAALGATEVLRPRWIPVYFGLLQNYDADTFGKGLGQAWTLCIEIVFYAFLPLYAYLLGKVPARTRERRIAIELVALVALVAVSVAWKQWSYRNGHQVAAVGFPSYVDLFALGMILATVSVWFEERAPDEQPLLLRIVDRFPGIPWLVALGGYWYVCTQIGLTGDVSVPQPPETMIARHELFGGIAFFLLLPAIFGRQNHGLVRRLLANRVLLFLGLISYSIYLWQALVLLEFFPHLGPIWHLPEPFRFFAWAIAIVGGTVAVSAVSYYVVERPSQLLGRKRWRTVAEDRAAAEQGDVPGFEAEPKVAATAS